MAVTKRAEKVKNIAKRRHDVEAKLKAVSNIAKEGKVKREQLQATHGSNIENSPELAELNAKIKSSETELADLTAELDEIDAMDGLESTETPPTGQAASPGGQTGALPSKTGLSPDDDDDVTFTIAQSIEASGGSSGGKVVAWKRQVRSTPVIVQYGPKNAAIYERSTARNEDLYDEKTTVQFGPLHRLGDERAFDEKKGYKVFQRQKHELVGVLGIALNKGIDVEDLRPQEKAKKGGKGGDEGKPARTRPPPLEIFIKWKIDGKISRTWEVRSSIRHLFGSPEACDKYIYDAAKYHANRHQEWVAGQRPAENRSPTADPNAKPLANIKQEVDEDSEPNGAYEKFVEQWAKGMGLNPENLTPEAQAIVDQSWVKTGSS